MKRSANSTMKRLANSTNPARYLPRVGVSVSKKIDNQSAGLTLSKLESYSKESVAWYVVRHTSRLYLLNILFTYKHVLYSLVSYI